MTDKDRNAGPSGNAPSWVDEVLSSSSSAPRPVEGRHGQTADPAQNPAGTAPGSGWDHWPQTDAARDLRLPGDPPRPAPPSFDSDDWVARATGGEVRDPQGRDPQESRTTVYSAAPQTDAWGDPVRPAPPAPVKPVRGQMGQSNGPAGLPVREDIAQKKLIAGLLGIFLGSLGVHKFYLGQNGAGLLMLGVNIGVWVLAIVLSLLTLGLGAIILFPLAGFVTSVLGVIGLIEGILYLTKSDADFQRDYLYGNKAWF